jgi:hypothetical protein
MSGSEPYLSPMHHVMACAWTDFCTSRCCWSTQDLCVEFNCPQKTDVVATQRGQQVEDNNGSSVNCRYATYVACGVDVVGLRGYSSLVFRSAYDVSGTGPVHVLS